jgi:hypothetical protein
MKFNSVLVAGGIALAATLFFGTSGPRDAALAQNQAQSNYSLDALANRINQDISSLNGDRTDYGGHRLEAIRFMQISHNQIAAAEQFAAANGHVANAMNPGQAVAMAPGGERRPQAGSDENMVYVQNDLRGIASQMNGDSYDYGGHKSKALEALNNAVNSLEQALQYRRTHAPGT